MKALETGNIYSFHYRRFTVDPNPLVLVLYCDDDICHAINLHYLPKPLSEELIDMIAKIAIKNVKLYSMYHHYHNWMKKNIPHVIKHAYRTYKPNQMTSIHQVTKGRWGIKSFIDYQKEKEKHLTLSKVQERLSTKINKEKKKKVPKKINLNKLEEHIMNYVNEADDLIQKAKTKDESLYTKLYKRGKK